jgi:hypothetical protein
VKRAGPDTLARIVPLLAALRSRAVLCERQPGVFELKSRAFLHFHDDPAGVFADVRLAEGFVRLRVSSRSEQADLLDRIDACLDTIETQAAKRRRQSPRREGRREPQ